MRAGDRNIDHRGTIHRNPKRDEIAGNQTGIGPGQAAGLFQIRLRRLRKNSGRRRVPPMGSLEAGDTAALLIDQYRRVAPPDGFPETGNQSPQLIG